MKYCFVYVDCKPNGTPFYIGKGNKARLKNLTRNSHHSNICKKYPDWYRGLVFAGSEKDCHIKEMELIAKFGRSDLGQGSLVNYTDGGEGISNPTFETRQKLSKVHSGKVTSEQTKKKLSMAHKGKTLSEEHKFKLSLVKLGKPSGWKGKTASVETKEKMRLAKLGKPGAKKGKIYMKVMKNENI
jgi:hypothetical protein